MKALSEAKVIVMEHELQAGLLEFKFESCFSLGDNDGFVNCATSGLHQKPHLQRTMKHLQEGVS